MTLTNDPFAAFATDAQLEAAANRRVAALKASESSASLNKAASSNSLGSLTDDPDAQENDPTPRWRLIGHLAAEPTTPLVLPVRDARVLFGLERRHYDNFAASQIAQPHELFCPMEALIADRGHESPAMHALIHRASVMSNFMEPV